MSGQVLITVHKGCDVYDACGVCGTERSVIQKRGRLALYCTLPDKLVPVCLACAEREDPAMAEFYNLALAEPMHKAADRAADAATSQEVADVLSRAYDATRAVLIMLEEDDRTYPTPGSLEHVAFAVLLERVVPLGSEFACRLSHYLRHLPEPTEPRRYDIRDHDIPF